MARKLFISVLGTGRYVPVHYQFDNEDPSKLTKFVQIAIIEHICKEWTNNDRIIICYTEASKRINWIDQSLEEGSSHAAGLKTSLEAFFKSNNNAPQINDFLIPEGFSEKEVWEIFETIYSNINQEDIIYLDVTHAFRSIPLFSTSLLNYARFMKDAQISGIYYGAFEKLGTAKDVSVMPESERIAPIIDMSSILRLQEYTSMADSFLTYGKIKDISNSLNNQKQTSNIKDPSYQIINQVCTNIVELDDSIIQSKRGQIQKGNNANSIYNSIKALKKLGIPQPIFETIARLSKKLKDFGFVNNPKSDFQLSKENIKAAIKWDLEYDLIPQAVTLTREYILSFLVKIIPMDNWNQLSDKQYSEFLGTICLVDDISTFDGAMFRKYKSVYPNEETRHMAESEIEKLATTIRAKYQLFDKLHKPYSNICSARNQINHANGNNKEGYNPESFLADFESCMTIIDDYHAN